MDFSKVIIMTDLDGTLLTDDKRILQKDLDAVDRFRKGGGLFTVATGRGYAMARRIIEQLRLNMPAVIFNGASVYDFRCSKPLWNCTIEDGAYDYIPMLIKEFPDLGVEILSEQKVYVPYANQVIYDHLALEQLDGVEIPFEDVPKGCFKMLLGYPKEKIELLMDFAQKNCSKGVNWVHSAPMYFEMLPKGISKAEGFKKLLEITGNTDKFTVAAGDYGNDYAMIRAADFGVAVANAQDEVKSAAKRIVCDNNSGAMSEIIDIIEKL